MMNEMEFCQPPPAPRRFTHFTHNVQRKNIADLTLILGSWDDSSIWDSISIQEITNNASDDFDNDEPVVLREVGRGRHTVVLSPQRRVHFRVAVVVHHRWASSVVATKSSFRWCSVCIDLRVKQGVCVRIISSHIPSAINCSHEEIELHIQDLGNMICGLRRHRVLLGMDANIHIGRSSATSATSGRALG